ncbi:uncharacterized protein LOC135207919 isoform X2 [Macrobrachium nipponense]|uniref:uncharacterized protein LOC135207919 isoform X2 n=1 Tax=Macrobrachium nipponense TaxID=159736 RepID=UPI0030C870F0
MWVLAFLLFVDRGLSADALECSYNEIACAKDETCIVQDYICDDSYDCNDESDEDKELCGVWRNDRCPVKSALCIRNGNESCVEISEYCSTANPPCEGNVDRRICSMLRRGRLLDLNSFRAGWNWNMSEQLGEAFREVIPFTISHEKCPLMYTLVGESCVSIFLIGNVTWAEARAFCNVLDGDLMTFSNKSVSLFADIVQHLQKLGLERSFWIGGSLQNASKGWTWIDGSPMVMGTPFWATTYSPDCGAVETEEVCRRYRQRPEEPAAGNCASLSLEHFFYITDEDCLDRRSPLCVSRSKPSSGRGHLQN